MSDPITCCDECGVEMCQHVAAELTTLRSALYPFARNVAQSPRLHMATMAEWDAAYEAYWGHPYHMKSAHLDGDQP